MVSLVINLMTECILQTKFNMSNPKNPTNQPLGLSNLNYLFNQAIEHLVKQDKEKKSLIISNRSQLLALVVHLALIAVGFQPKFITNEASSSTESSQETLYWNEEFDGREPFVFQYRHPQSQLEFLTKGVSLFNKLIINATVSESSNLFTLNLVPEDYVPDQVQFPINLSVDNSHDLKSYFSSTNKFESLLTSIQTDLIQKLIPGLHKEGYQEIHTGNPSASQSSSSERLRTSYEPPRFQPAGNNNPYSEDPTGISVNPYNYGASDLDPLGGRSGLGLPRVGGGSALDPFGGIGSNRGGGMILGPHHPLFRGGTDPSSNLPSGMVPPGARFDPITPQFPGVAGIPQPNRPRPNRRFPGEPNNDEFMPPGFGNDNMYM